MILIVETRKQEPTTRKGPRMTARCHDVGWTLTVPMPTEQTQPHRYVARLLARAMTPGHWNLDITMTGQTPNKITWKIDTE
ncbi:MAG: hypothetical protein LC723_06420 [Actinobacteria bacterium]|nr:hypothetical protein [Actinomycetota bacterium]